MMDQEKANVHIDALHVDRQLQEDLDRMLRERILAASSFVDMRTKDVLTTATLCRQKKAIDAWLCKNKPDLRLTLHTTFDDKDAVKLQVPVTHLGFARDTATDRIWLCKTNTVAVVLQLSQTKRHAREYFIYNVYPYVQNPSDEQKLDMDVLPYARLTKTWQQADAMQRTYIRIICDHLDRYQVTFDLPSRAIYVTVREQDHFLGQVTLTPEHASWRLTDERRPIACRYPNMESVMRRAFPDTYATIDYVRSLYQATVHDMDLERNTPSIIEALPYDLRTAICTVPKSPNDDKTTTTSHKKSQEPDEDAIRRRRQRALSRSKRTSKQTGKRAHKTRRKQNAPKNTTQQVPKTDTPAVRALQDKNITDQKRPTDTRIASSWIATVMHHNIAMVCPKTEQALIWMRMLPEHQERRIAIARMSPDMIDSVRDAMTDAYSGKITTEDMNHIHLIDYRDAFSDIERSKAYKPLSDTAVKIIIDRIAHDHNWQPLVSDDIFLWLLSHIRAEITRGTIETLTRPLDLTMAPTDVIAERAYQIPPLQITESRTRPTKIKTADPKSLSDKRLVNAISKLSRTFPRQQAKTDTTAMPELTTSNFFDTTRTICG